VRFTGRVAQVGGAEVHVDEHGADETRSVEPRHGERGIAQVDASETRAGEVLAAQVGTRAAAQAAHIAIVLLQDVD